LLGDIIHSILNVSLKNAHMQFAACTISENGFVLAIFHSQGRDKNQ
jgi:hypothetical protein